MTPSIPGAVCVGRFPPRRWFFAVVLTFIAVAAPLGAQAVSGTVVVTVTESMDMVGGLQVRSAGRVARTDSTGRARLVLPPGTQVISVTGIGHLPTRAIVSVVADSVVTVTIPIEMGVMQMEEVKVSAARIERLAGDSPTRVEVLDSMEVDENTLMSPSGVSMLLNETPGLRVQSASPSLGTGSVRILGLPGQYTVMLSDGLPLYGGASSALGPLDISPVDLQRVEIIKGAASSLYGAQALGGVINLISRQPTGKSEALVNRRTLGVTDVAGWTSHRFDDGLGLSLLATGTNQESADVDQDGWMDQPRAKRFGVRPRLSATDDKGRSLFMTAGFGYDERNGGGITPTALQFREGLTSTRADFGGRAVIPVRDSQTVALRFALSGSRRQREFGSGPKENDGINTGFLELTRSLTIAGAPVVVGSSAQYDGFSNTLNSRYDHDWITPSLFATTERDAGPVTLSLSARADAHPAAGTQVTERIAALVKPADDWSVRLSAGTGFAPPTPLTEETEAIGLRAIRAGSPLHLERSVGSMLDIDGRLAGAELLVTTYGSIIRNAIQLADAGDGSTDATLVNASGDTKIAGVEAAALWRFEGGKFLGTYGYSRGSRPDAMSGARETLPMQPRHHVGADLMFERPGVYWGGIEGTWYGVQALDDNPYRAESKPYLYLMAIFVRKLGHVEAVANFENLLNVRQTDTDPLVRPTPGMGGQWTTGVWGPVEGFMANLALRYRW